MMPERYAVEKSRRKRHMVKFELDGITAKKRKPRLVEVYSDTMAFIIIPIPQILDLIILI